MPSLRAFQIEGPALIPLADVKAYLRITDTAQDTVLNSLILAACEYVETFTGLKLQQVSYSLKLDYFPRGNVSGLLSPYTMLAEQQDASPYYCGSSIVLPRFPVYYHATSNPVSIVYFDTSGTEQTLTVGTTGDYRIDADSRPGRIYLGVNATWPATQQRTNAVEVFWTAGFLTSSALGDTDGRYYLPDGILQAIKILVAHWYEHREPIIVGGNIGTVPMSVESLLWANRVVTL